MSKTRLPAIIEQHEKELLKEWQQRQKEALSGRRDRISETQLRANSQDFLRALAEALSKGASSDISQPEWTSMRDLLGEFSKNRATQGFTPTETAIFVFSFKQPLFALIASEYAEDKQGLAGESWTATELLDRLGLYTAEIFLKNREEIILRQQQEMLELSTPVVELWHGVLALPLIGTLDSARTQIVMQNLLEAIVARGSDLAIIDITGVPTVDTLVAQHLLKTVAAARLMGADCIISGIRPQIAQTIIHLGVDLSGVMTKATLADAFQLALKRKNLTVGRS
ncbi:MAG TPA: STAS domain-containing protein [Bryobacteraceae bacterium]|jgi:rsbT co-antagonist protein RsbR|nr:STAS domain-containing protein [Bryobacteraceae bacterium]